MAMRKPYVVHFLLALTDACIGWLSLCPATDTVLMFSKLYSIIKSISLMCTALFYCSYLQAVTVAE